MSKTTIFGILSSVSFAFAAYPAYGAPTVSYIEEIRTTVTVKAGKWSKRQDQNNRTRMEVAVGPAVHAENQPYEFYMFFVNEQDKLKNGDVSEAINFTVSPSRLDNLNLSITMKKFGFKGKYIGFDWADIIPYTIESATSHYPLRNVPVSIDKDVAGRLRSGQAIELKKSYTDGTQLVVQLAPSVPKEATISQIQAMYVSNCQRYAQYARGSRPFESNEERFAHVEKIANLHSILVQNGQSTSEVVCTNRVYR